MRQLTTAEFIEKARAVHGNRYDYGRSKYEGYRKEVVVGCMVHGFFVTSAASHLKGRDCVRCAVKAKSATYSFVAAARAIHGDRYDYSATEYKGRGQKVVVGCHMHGPFLTSPETHLRGANCMQCSGKAKGTTDWFIAKARAVHGERYDYSRVDYKGRRQKVCIICREHGEFWQDASNHVHRSSNCPTCMGVKRSTLEDFIRRAKDMHGDLYDYSQVVFIGVDHKVKIGCQQHGVFEQLAFDHMKGHGCAACGAEKAINAQRHDLVTFLERAKAKFGGKLDYSCAVYVNSSTKTEIKCPKHGSFWQTPHEHIASTGCPRCSSVGRVDRDEFFRRAFEVHGLTYDYSKIAFKGMRKKLKVICRFHGEFETVPKDHVDKRTGCPLCARARRASRGEKELAEWIESLCLEMRRNDRRALDGFEIDIYLPDRNLGIEYHGAYWHRDDALQHPRFHEMKALRAEKKGIRLLTVWDFHWATQREKVQQYLRHQLGISDSRRRDARACIVVETTAQRAAMFHQMHRLSGPPISASLHYALEDEGRLVACMSFGRTTSRCRSAPDEWDLLSFSTDGIVRGGASRLFAAFIRKHKPKTVWSFADRQHFGSALYEMLGFTKAGRVTADYQVYHQGKNLLWEKDAWRREYIPQRLNELGIDEVFNPGTDPRTEAQMQAFSRCFRVMDAGKTRWKWTART
ncbi:PDDEXK family nuclease [Paraburkholderia caledonica]|uniref:C2H2 Zn-finger protein n=1 Tax=Paraburkholderia caledonica TaxID=134536 RepID=A0AB73I6G4_9BURK|nr:putative C2H2 Zn-finger protein [Paraburkholderia caledonica]